MIDNMEATSGVINNLADAVSLRGSLNYTKTSVKFLNKLQDVLTEGKKVTIQKTPNHCKFGKLSTNKKCKRKSNVKKPHKNIFFW